MAKGKVKKEAPKVKQGASGKRARYYAVNARVNARRKLERHLRDNPNDLGPQHKVEVLEDRVNTGWGTAMMLHTTIPELKQHIQRNAADKGPAAKLKELKG